MIKCDKRAFSKCKYKEHCGLDAEFSEGSECEKFNRLIIHQPMTNADRIRTMSDDRLARFLCDFRSCDSIEHPCEGCNAEPYCHTGHMGMIDWLRKPAEED